MAKNKKQKKQKKHRVFWFLIKLQIVLMILVLCGLGYYYYGGYAKEVQTLKREAIELVRASDEKTFIPSQTSVIYDIDGNVITETRTEKDSLYVNYQDIPFTYVSAMVSIEDKKFYKHNGVDYKAILRAVKAIIEDGKLSQGGSTITMQLARNIYLDTDKNWRRKVKEMFIAVELEKRYSKEKIMEFYLNNIYFANGYYGVGAACRGYFDKELNELSLSEIAFLCAIPNSPTYYDPLVSPENTIERRDKILRNMLEDQLITQEEYDEAIAEEIVLSPPQDKGTPMNNSVDTYVYNCATRALMENEGFVFQDTFFSEEEEENYTQEYNEMYTYCQKQLFSGGYKIYTTIDMEKQELLQQAVDDALSDYTEVSEEGVYTMQGAAVCIDNETGFVVAIVGGRNQDFSMYTLNRAYQSHRQPGSAIKPLIVYTPFFERGLTLDTIVVDEEIEGGPKNAGGGYIGETTVQTAIEKSLNTIAWKLYEELTPDVGLSYLEQMNFRGLCAEDYVLATSIGGFTQGVSALEMASAYATIENDGLYREPTCIKKIVDSSQNTVYVSEQVENVVYTETASRIMTDAMEGVMQQGTGAKYKLETMPCAGKTGTTNDDKDAWLVGYTRYYTTSVWVGYDMPRQIENLLSNNYPGIIWNNYMETIHEDLTPMEFLPYAKLSDEFIESQTPSSEDDITNDVTNEEESMDDSVEEAPLENEEETQPENVQEPVAQTP